MADYEMVEYKGEQVRKYPNGSLRREDGTLVLPSEAHAITPANAKALVARRWQKARAAAAEAIRQETGFENVYDGVTAILRKRVQVALTDNGRAGNDAAKLVLQAAEMYRDHRVKEIIESKTHELSPRSIEFLREFSRLRNDPDHEFLDAPEGEVIEGETSEEAHE